jgi:branched-chain amino acid transport system ATP-binding protein
MSVLLVEQNVAAALEISDYAYVTENGRIVLQGKPEELAANEHVKKAYLGVWHMKTIFKDVGWGFHEEVA